MLRFSSAIVVISFTSVVVETDTCLIFRRQAALHVDLRDKDVLSILTIIFAVRVEVPSQLSVVLHIAVVIELKLSFMAFHFDIADIDDAFDFAAFADRRDFSLDTGC